MSKRKSLRIGGTVVHLMLAASCLSFFDCGPAAADYSFKLDRFEVSGQVNESDEFDDGLVEPWEIHDPTVEESGGFLSLSSPGTVIGGVLDGFYYLNEMSFIGSNPRFVVENGQGDFTGISRWSPIIPGVNQWYEMEVCYEVQQDPRISIDISVGVANWDSEFAGIMGIDPGLGISFYLSGDTFIWQHILISEDDLTSADAVLLKLDFYDDTDEFRAGFSLDGGASYTYFPELIGWDQPTPGRYDWFFGAQAILDLQPIDTLSGLVWMVSGTDFGYSLEEGNFVYFLSSGPVWYYNFTTGLWDSEGPADLVYVDWPFMYEIATGSFWFVLPPVSGLWVYHFSTGQWGFLPQIIP